MLQLVVNTGVKSGPKELQSLIATLKAQNKVDRVFTDLVTTSMEDCQKQGNDVLADILKYTKTFLGVLASKEKAVKAAPNTAAVPGSPNRKKPAAEVKEPVVEPLPTALEPKEMAEVASPPPPSSSAKVGGSRDSGSLAERESKMVQAGLLLQEMLRDNAGDASALKTDAIQRCLSGEVDDNFLHVVEDNIKGCREAGYVNKVKVLEYLGGVVRQQLELQAQQRDDAHASSAYAGNTNTGGSTTTTHHAPQFVDDATASARGTKRHISDVDHVEVTLLPDVEKEFINAVEASAALRGVAPAAVGAGNSSAKVNNKKKSVKSAGKKVVQKMATAASEHLQRHGWAVLDNFLPLELVQRVRVESGLFRSSFEQSEIWVGKQADVGAQLSVPSVRGDKVSAATRVAPTAAVLNYRRGCTIDTISFAFHWFATCSRFHGLEH
jgi:hypothetical protein